jgi:hypothetical protein
MGSGYGGEPGSVEGAPGGEGRRLEPKGTVGSLGTNRMGRREISS